MSSSTSKSSSKSFTIVDLNFVSIYVKDYEKAVDYYSRVFGPARELTEKEDHHGWRMGRTWLTVFPARGARQTRHG